MTKPKCFSSWFVGPARALALDAVSGIILYVTAALGAGRVWRFPFDDEISTLTYVQSAHSIGELGFAGHGFHPPLLFVYLRVLQSIGVGEAGMRACSLAMTAISLAIVQLLTLAIISRRTGKIVRPSMRLLAVLLFGLSPLAIGVGDAIRWYPLFALLVSTFLLLYVAGDNAKTRMASAVPLGLATSTNFIAAAVIAPFLLYRHILQRRFCLRFDALYWLVFAVFAGLAIPKAIALAFRQLPGVAHAEFGESAWQAITSDALGFFGGNALGISQAWFIIPMTLIAVYACFSAIDRKDPENPAHLFVLTIGTVALVALTGFGKPRSFLYLAPMVAAVLTLLFDRIANRSTALAMLAAALAMAGPVATIANVNHNARPFKRNLAVPFGQILDFIQTNARGSTLVISSDPVIVWELQRWPPGKDLCISYFVDNRDCFADLRRYESIFVVWGQSNRSRNANYMRRVEATIASVTEGKHAIAKMHAGLDEDAALKTRLTHVPLDKFILEVTLYD